MMKYDQQNEVTRLIRKSIVDLDREFFSPLILVASCLWKNYQKEAGKWTDRVKEMTSRYSRVECPEKPIGQFGKPTGFSFVKTVFNTRSSHVWSWRARPEDTNAQNENSTDFQLGTDDTKGYRGSKAWGLHKYMLQSEIFSHFINVGVCDVACVRCFVHMHESWEGLRLFETQSSWAWPRQRIYCCQKKEDKTNKSIEGKLFGYIFTVLTLNFALDI